MLWHPPALVVRGAGKLSRGYVGGATRGGAFSRATKTTRTRAGYCNRSHAEVRQGKYTGSGQMAGFATLMLWQQKEGCA